MLGDNTVARSFHVGVVNFYFSKVAGKAGFSGIQYVSVVSL